MHFGKTMFAPACRDKSSHWFAEPEAALPCCCRDQAQDLAKKLQKELEGERAKNKRLQANLETMTQDR